MVGTDIVERYFAARAGHKGIKMTRGQQDAWRAIVEKAQCKRPEDVKKAHPTASRVREVLSGKRELSMPMVRKMRERFHISADLLISRERSAGAAA